MRMWLILGVAIQSTSQRSTLHKQDCTNSPTLVEKSAENLESDA